MRGKGRGVEDGEGEREGREEGLRERRGGGRGNRSFEGASLAHCEGPFLFPTCRRGSLSGLGPIVWGREPHWQGINL